MGVEGDVDVKIVDLPMAHLFRIYEEEGSAIKSGIFDSFAKVQDITLFESVVVRKLIYLQWPLVRAAIFRCLFLPYIFFLATFFVYSNFLQPSRIKEDTLLVFSNIL